MSTTVDRKPGRLKIGSLVSFVFGTKPVTGVIVEDRGPLGAGGRRLYRIRLPIEAVESFELEMPEDEITPEESRPQGTLPRTSS
jgi:hypothetical protein